MRLTRHIITFLFVLLGLVLVGSAFAGLSASRITPRPHAGLPLPFDGWTAELTAETFQEIDTGHLEALAVEPACGWPHALVPVAAFLELDEVQTGMLLQLLHQRHIAAWPIVAELRQHEAELADLLQDDQPDPVLVGQVVLEIRELRHAVLAIQIDFMSEFEGMLDPDQRERLALIRAAVAVSPVIPAFASLHLI